MKPRTPTRIWMTFLGASIFAMMVLGTISCDFMAFDVWPPAHEKKNGNVCIPDCDGRECGSDGCGDICGLCTTGEVCTDGVCEVMECEPECDGKLCGPDGCSGSCGSCPARHCCQDGQCLEADCTGLECGADPICNFGCGDCPPQHRCIIEIGQCECVPNCDGLSCGEDLCGVSCGDCPLFHECRQGECFWVPDEYEPHCVDRVCFVPAGPFMMGCDDDVDPDCRDDDSEYPYHAVDVPAFWIHSYQVTVGYYSECVQQGECDPPSEQASPGTSHHYCNARYEDRLDRPLNCVTWQQARAFCSWAGMRLCSEAEWEKAARGTDGRRYPWGFEAASCVHAILTEPGGVRGCGEDRTWPVGSKPLGVSPYGAHDMAGNVFDWVEDDWNPDYTGAPTDGSPWIDSPRAEARPRRGGSFHDGYSTLRVSARYRTLPHHLMNYVGFRCCLTHDESN